MSHAARPLACAALAALLCACPGSQATQAPDAGMALDPNDPKALLAAVDQLAGPMKDKPKSFEVLSALGNLYYENQRYLDAVDAWRQALELAAPAEAEAQALQKKGVKPAAELPSECRRSGPSYGLEQIAEVARKLAPTDPPKALRCYQEAVSASYAARAKRGNGLYLVGQPDGALAEHKRVLERIKDYPESLFFVGAIILEQSKGDKAQLEEGKRWWRRLLEVAPDHPRAALVKESLPKADELFTPRPEAAQAQPQAGGPGAGGQLPPGHPPIAGGEPNVGPVKPGVGELPPGHPPLEGAGGAAPGALPAGPLAGNTPGAPLGPRGGAPPAPISPDQMNAVAEAVGQTERTPELEKGLDELTAQAEADLDAGRYQDARNKMVRVMPMRPNDPRTAAGLGGAMRGLGRTDMAERTLLRALDADPRNARALFEMGKLLADRGDKAGARSRFQALQAADAKWAAAHGVAGELAKLR